MTIDITIKWHGSVKKTCNVRLTLVLQLKVLVYEALAKVVIPAILLFQEESISLGKAAELAEVSRVRFMEALKEHGLPSYEYGEKDFERDQEAIAKYREEVGR